MERSFSLRRFGLAVGAFAIVLAVATIGFRLIEEDSWVAAFYRSVVTTSLTGLDTRPRTTGGQIFAIFILFSGVAIFLYVAGTLVEMIARGVLTGAWAERKRRRMIEALHEHYIICGYGRVGRRIAREFRESGVDYVVLDFNAEVMRTARERREHTVQGSGTSDSDLQEAGILHARGLVAASDSDVDNVYITLSARAVRPDLLIVARASNEDAATKLRRAGADRVVQPYSAAGQEMAKLVLRPQVAAFLDIVTSAGGPDLRLEEIEVTGASGQSGRTIRDLRVRHETGALIVALRKRDGTFDTTPNPDVVLEVGDVLIAVGTEQELRALEELFAPREAVAG